MIRLLNRLSGRYRRTVASCFSRRMVEIHAMGPIISFSFDDAPQSAFTAGGEILGAHGIRATFYVSLGLLGARVPEGRIALAGDLHRAAAAGHELGCHTYDHLDAWKTPAEEFEQSIVRNRLALADMLPEVRFESFAYPINEPRPESKRRAGTHFICCRGGGQTLNAGKTDLNLLKAHFLDARNWGRIDSIKRMVDKNIALSGWLIFATHDISENPSRYGCAKDYFSEVVVYTSRSGARILPVAEGCREILDRIGGRNDKQAVNPSRKLTPGGSK
jgi:peptidoglycan/xylan/chitin deacetylase (PgdA/CDA1 family)